MTKVNRAYPHLLGGVSQEPSERRGAGEHWAQDNFISDPVRGMTRRAGAKYLDYLVNADESETDDPAVGRTRTYDFQVGENYLSLVYDTAAVADGGTGVVGLFNKTTGQLVQVTQQASAGLTSLLTGGITSAVAMGRFVLLAGPALLPVYTTTERYGVASNLQHHIIWIRGGAYARQYRIALVRGNQKLWVEYTTPAASYPEPLDTSGLNVNDPDYLKQVNDLTNQYNSAVNAWIASALAAAQPENIASTLAAVVTNSGFLGTGETCTATGPNIYILAPSVEDVEVEDGGDGSLARGVGNTVPAAELLSLYHIPGKIVRVRPNNSTDGQCFYMEAIPKDGSTGALTEVSWRETAGTRFTPTVVFGILAVDDAGDSAYLGVDTATLRAAHADFDGLPDYTASDAGDLDSNAPQRFLGEPATGLGTFQDRLIVLCNNSVNGSKTSDYFNFFRASIVTVAADDPVSFVAIGGEDDILRYALTYDRNLVLWGTGQYLVDGRKPYSPATASAVRMASIKDALTAPPVLGDKFIYFGRTREDGTGSVHHLQPGRIQEAPETFELSRRLKSYIQGSPAEVVPANDPDYLYIRSTGDNALKVFAYQDAANGERVLAAWSRWTFDSYLGELVGVSVHNGAVFLLFYKYSTVDEGGNYPVRQFLGKVMPTPGDEPYLDMWCLESDATVPADFDAACTAAYDATGNYAGEDGAPAAGTLYKGFQCPSTLTLTSPFATDRDGLPILLGRTVVNTVRVWTHESSGFQYLLRAQGQPDGMGAWVVPTGTAYEVPSPFLGTVARHLAPVGNGTDTWEADTSGTLTNMVKDDGTIPLRVGSTGLMQTDASSTGFGRFWFATPPPFDTTGAPPDYVPYPVAIPAVKIGAHIAGLINCVTPAGSSVHVTIGEGALTGLVSPHVSMQIDMNGAGGTDLYLYAGFGAVVASSLGNPAVTVGDHAFTIAIVVDADGLNVAARVTTGFGIDVELTAPIGVGGPLDGPQTCLVYTDGHPIGTNTRCVIQDVAVFGFDAADAVVAEDTPVWNVTSGVSASSTPVNETNGVDANGLAFVNGEYRAYNEDLTTADIASLAPFEHANATIPVGRETREYRLTLQSYLWAPLTLKAIEWMGQLLYRSRRL
jgi:hypothetical protein